MGKSEDCILELKYFRLSHTRTLKESYRFNVWQSQTFLGPTPPSSRVKGHVQVGLHGDAGQYYGMRPVGKDAIDPELYGDFQISMVSADSGGKTWNIEFDALNLAQVPSFLLISAPRLGQMYSLEDGTAAMLGANCARNLSRNLSIKKLKIIVNSARGAIDEDGSDQTGFVNAERLFELTQENAGSHYFAKGGFRSWRDYGCAVLLNSSQFAPGLQVCDGISYPVSIRVEAEFVNRAVKVCSLDTGVAACADLARQLATSAIGLQLSRDYIRAQGQVTAIFTKVVLSTTETSATTNAMNFPLDTAERLMSAAGAMR